MKVNVHCRTVTIPARMDNVTRETAIDLIRKLMSDPTPGVVRIGNVVVRVEELVGVEVI